MPKLLILTQYYPPEMGAPQARLSELAGYLKLSGWDIQVLTTMPNYPTGKVFEGYSNTRYKCENINGIEVIRTWLKPSQSASFIPRIICYLSFAFSSYYWGRKKCKKPDLIWIESPPLFLCWSGIKLAKHWQIPYALNISDLWPDSFIHMGKMSINDISYKILKKLEKNYYNNSIGITGQSSGILKTINTIAPSIRTELITNGVDPERYGNFYRDDKLRKEHGWDNKFVFIYAGLHGLAQGLDQIIEAAKRLRENENVLFAFFGDGPCKVDLIKVAADNKLKNIQFNDIVKKENMPRVLASGDAALITLGSPILGAVPSKIYEAMASEIPILLVAEGEPAERVLSANAGIAVNCGDIDSLVNAINLLMQDEVKSHELSIKGREAAEKLYSRKMIAQKLDVFLKTIITKDKI